MTHCVKFRLLMGSSASARRPTLPTSLTDQIHRPESQAFFVSATLVSILVSGGEPVQSWPVQDAKARFSEFLERCLAEGPQMVTKRGAEAAVLVPAREWRRLQVVARPSLKDLLMSNEARTEVLASARGRARRRTPPALR